MAQSQKNMREILVGTAVAAETTLKTFTASASTGELQILAKDGGAAAAGKPFVVAQKTATGVILSDVVNPTLIDSEAVLADEAEVQKVVTIDDFVVPATAGDKYEYQIDIRLAGYGSLSVEDFKIYHGHHVLTQTTGPLTAESAVDALILNLNRNFSKEAGATATTNPLFTFAKTGAGATAAITITAKAQTLELGKKEGRPLEFEVTAKVSKVGDEAFGVAQPTVAVTTPAFVGVGTGRQVALMEWFYRGNRGDAFRGLNFPYNWPTTTKTNSDPASSYNLFEIRYHEVGDGLNQIELSKSIVIAISEALSAGVDALVARYNTFTGKSVAALGEV